MAAKSKYRGKLTRVRVELHALRQWLQQAPAGKVAKPALKALNRAISKVDEALIYDVDLPMTHYVTGSGRRLPCLEEHEFAFERHQGRIWLHRTKKSKVHGGETYTQSCRISLLKRVAKAFVAHPKRYFHTERLAQTIGLRHDLKTKSNAISVALWFLVHHVGAVWHEKRRYKADHGKLSLLGDVDALVAALPRNTSLYEVSREEWGDGFNDPDVEKGVDK